MTEARAHRVTPVVDHDRVRAAMKAANTPYAAAWAEQVRIRNAAHVAAGGRICRRLTRTGELCTIPAVGMYSQGWRCAHHTPAALDGRRETRPDPALTVEGIRRAWYADQGLAYVEQTGTPLSSTEIDRRAVASGKRRAAPESFRQARRQ